MAAADSSIALDVREEGRLDRLLLQALQATRARPLSRSRLKELFEAGRIRLAGRPAAASLRLAPGHYIITIEGGAGSLDEAPRALPSVRGAFLPVVYQDRDLLVLNKLSGVPSLPLAPGETETAVGAALAADPGLAEVGRGGLEPGLLHRLDTGTSGLLVFARTPEAFEWLKSAWKTGKVRKIYRALAPPLRSKQKLPLELALQMGHDARSTKRMCVIPSASPNTAQRSKRGAMPEIRGKALSTLTHIIHAQPAGSTLWDYQIEIQTGVMHQIRCTLAHLGAPILGDPIYRGETSNRLWLHAWRLELSLPHGGELFLQSALPPEWPSSSG